MCGIVGYIGNKSAASVLLAGLERLEYRGYDSAGIAVNRGQEIEVTKEAGKLEDLKRLVKDNFPEGNIGIGHTRWATHGKPSKVNSHPHCGCTEDFVIVHNGIIENYQHLKDELIEKGHIFQSETDTEVVAHLLEENYDKDLKTTIIKIMDMLEGSYALSIMSKDDPEKIFAVRKDSPLIVGKSDNENFIASDIPAFLDYTREFYILDEGEMAEVCQNNINIYNQQGDKIDKEIFEVDWDAEMAEKSGYEHFMLKEINEQPDAIRRVLNNRISPAGIEFDEFNLTKEEIKQFDKIQIVACGTAYHSGLVGEYLLEELAEIPVDVDIASEFRYREPILGENTLVIVVSQSGETADTLAALRLAQQRGNKVIALSNVRGSTISREADDVLYLKAGPEIAVASTKAYVNMVVAFYILALYMGESRNTISDELKEKLIDDIMRLPDLTRNVIEDCEEVVKRKAKEYSKVDNTFFIGRNIDYTLAMEGALKLKEISYIHAEAYPAGELKHGTLALIEDGVPVISIATRKKIREKTLSNIKEVKARGAEVLAIVHDYEETEYRDAIDELIEIPPVHELISPVLAIIPLQLLSYYTAVEKGCDIDQPRNLAKSVTVE